MFHNWPSLNGKQKISQPGHETEGPFTDQAKCIKSSQKQAGTAV